MIRSSPGLPNMESLLIEPDNVSVPLRPNNASALSAIQGIITCPPDQEVSVFVIIQQVVVLGTAQAVGDAPAKVQVDIFTAHEGNIARRAVHRVSAGIAI